MLDRNLCISLTNRFEKSAFNFEFYLLRFYEHDIMAAEDVCDDVKQTCNQSDKCLYTQYFPAFIMNRSLFYHA
jgi:hypothetical protein